MSKDSPRRRLLRSPALARPPSRAGCTRRGYGSGPRSATMPWSPRADNGLGLLGRAGSAVAAPLAAMDDIGGVAAAFLDRRALRGDVGGAVPDRDAPDRVVITRHAELGPERIQEVGHDPEEAGAEIFVYRGQQHQQRRHPGVDVPVRRRPVSLSAIGPPLVGLRVALEVGSLVRQGDDHQGRVLHRRGLLDPGRHEGPEPGPVRRVGEREERPALRETRRRRAQRARQHPLDHLGCQRTAGVVPDHAAAADDLREFHLPILPSAGEDGRIGRLVSAGSRSELLDRVLDEELPRYAEALERLALGALIAFYGINGRRLTLTNDAYDLVMKVAAGRLDSVEDTAAVLAEATQPRP